MKKNIATEAVEEVTAETTVETAENVQINTTEPLAYLVRKDEGYFIEHLDGTLSDKCRIVVNDEWILFPQNAANRKYVKVTVAEKFFAENGDDAKMPLLYKATRTVGQSTSTKIPNEKLISYLPEAEQEEYRAIIARAIAAREADKAAAKKPLTEKEKAMARLEKLKAQMAKLQAEIAEDNSDEN